MCRGSLFRMALSRLLLSNLPPEVNLNELPSPPARGGSMIFDRLASVVERHFTHTPWYGAMNAARLFHFTKDLIDVPEDITPVQRRFAGEYFFLPYKEVALVDSLSCTVLVDTAPDLHGPAVDRLYLVYFSNDRVYAKLGGQTPANLIGTYTVFGGVLKNIEWSLERDPPEPTVRRQRTSSPLLTKTTLCWTSLQDRRRIVS